MDAIRTSIKEGDDKKLQRAMTSAHIGMLDIHSRALACHCECLAMNAENCTAATIGNGIPYDQHHYFSVMKKWNLVDDELKPK